MMAQGDQLIESLFYRIKPTFPEETLTYLARTKLVLQIKIRPGISDPGAGIETLAGRNPYGNPRHSAFISERHPA